MASALAGVRVLDLSRVLAGPWASQILADLGADVIKIERPGSGDETRTWGPPYHTDAGGRATAAYFLGTNRGKRSLTVDFTKPAGADIIRRLAAESDVFLENHKVGDLARYGLDYATLRSINPKLVYCSITGFGQTGPYASRPGYDFAIQALSGLMSVTGEPDGAPQKVGVAVSDLMAGLYATVAILAALYHRGERGEGQVIDLALLDVQVAALANVALNYLVSGDVPGRWGNAHPNIVPYQVFPTADRPIVIAVGNDAQFARLCEVLEQPTWSGDARFATNDGRVRHRAALVSLISDALRHDARDTWLARLEAAAVPCAPINDVAELFADPQVAHRGLTFDLPVAGGGTVPQIASPLRLAATPPRVDVPPPALGEHTAAILQERLGMDAAKIAQLRREGVV